MEVVQIGIMDEAGGLWGKHHIASALRRLNDN